MASYDAVTLLGVLLFVGVTTAAACYLPVRRAVGVDPMEVLRHD